jgi:hypothetical protein
MLVCIAASCAVVANAELYKKSGKHVQKKNQQETAPQAHCVLHITIACWAPDAAGNKA